MNRTQLTSRIVLDVGRGDSFHGKRSNPVWFHPMDYEFPHDLGKAGLPFFREFQQGTVNMRWNADSNLAIEVASVTATFFHFIDLHFVSS